MNEYNYEDIKEGHEEKFTVTITKEMMDIFAEFSGDKNPLHTDEDYARSKGFKSRIVYGQLVASFYSTLVGMYLPGKKAILQSIDSKFNNPTFINDELTISGKVSYTNDNFKLIEVKAKIINQDNKKVSSAKINIGFIN